MYHAQEKSHVCDAHMSQLCARISLPNIVPRITSMVRHLVKEALIEFVMRPLSCVSNYVMKL